MAVAQRRRTTAIPRMKMPSEDKRTVAACWRSVQVDAELCEAECYAKETMGEPRAALKRPMFASKQDTS